MDYKMELIPAFPKCSLLKPGYEATKVKEPNYSLLARSTQTICSHDSTNTLK